MRKALKIDSDGYFIEDVIIEDDEVTPTNCIEVVCQDGFYKPKWNGSSWVEGLPQVEIDAIKSQPQPPTEEQRLSAVEDAITILMGV